MAQHCRQDRAKCVDLVFLRLALEPVRVKRGQEKTGQIYFSSLRVGLKKDRHRFHAPVQVWFACGCTPWGDVMQPGSSHLSGA